MKTFTTPDTTDRKIISTLRLRQKVKRDKLAALYRHLTLSSRRPLSYRNQSIDLQSKSMNWFLYDRGLRHERVKYNRKSRSKKS